MPMLACPDLGQIDFLENDILYFAEGLPAFETLRRFVLVRREEFAPFIFLVSVDSPGLRFICVPVGLLDPDYKFELAADEGAAAGLGEGVYSASSASLEAPLVLAIVTLPISAPATANLASPVVVDLHSHLGAQLILPGTAYSHVTPLQPFVAKEARC